MLSTYGHRGKTDGQNAVESPGAAGRTRPGRHAPCRTSAIIGLVPLTRQALETRGFSGFVPFSLLSSQLVPPDGGIHVVVRTSHSAPTFLATSTAGWRKGSSTAVSTTQLAAKWVEDAEVLYVGKADAGAAAGHGLRGRLRQYARHGAGGTSHHGGRYIWQLQDSAALLVAWKPALDPRGEEKALLAEFETLYKVLPFANLRH